MGQVFDAATTTNQISTMFLVTAPSQSNTIYGAGALVVDQSNSWAVGTAPGANPGKIRATVTTPLAGGVSLTLNLWSMSS
jgi:hypothetical protein